MNRTQSYFDGNGIDYKERDGIQEKNLHFSH